MVPSIIRRWQEVKTAILAERDRILDTVTATSHRIADSCGQEVTRLPVTIGCYTYTFALGGRGDYAWSRLENFYPTAECHWGESISHYESFLTALRALTESEVEFALLRELEQRS